MLVLVRATDASEGAGPPDPAMMEAMGRFNAELRAAGILRLADGLKASSAGARVAFDGADRAVSRGPFTPTEDLVAGFWI